MDNPQPSSQDRDNAYLIDLTLDDEDEEASDSNDRQGQAHGQYLHWQQPGSPLAFDGQVLTLAGGVAPVPFVAPTAVMVPLASIGSALSPSANAPNRPILTGPAASTASAGLMFPIAGHTAVASPAHAKLQLPTLAPNGSASPPSGYQLSTPAGQQLTAPLPAGRPLKLLISINVRANYALLLDGAPPTEATPPLNLALTIPEVLAFFPQWIQVPDFVVRAIQNGWTRRQLAKCHLHAIGLLDKPNLKREADRVQQHISRGGKLYFGVSEWSKAKDISANEWEDVLTANCWEMKDVFRETGAQSWVHVSLAAAASRVMNWPTGTDRGLLTDCMEFALANPHLNLDTSHWNAIIHLNGWQRPQGLDHQLDVQAAIDLDNNVAYP